MPKGHNSYDKHQNNEHNEHQTNHLRKLKMLITSWKEEMRVRGEESAIFFFKASEVICYSSQIHI